MKFILLKGPATDRNVWPWTAARDAITIQFSPKDSTISVSCFAAFTQVLYYDASAFMGHYVMVNGMSFLRCTATTVSPELKYNTGYAAAARRLQTGDRVYVKIAYPNRVVDMHADSTYFGMFKFSD